MSREVPEGWRSVRLGEVAREDRSRNADGKIPSERLVGVFKKDGMIPMRERVKGVSFDRCKIVQPGSFAFNPMRINIGSIARSSHADAVMVSPDYVVFSAIERILDGSYLEHLRRSAEWDAYVGNAGDGGVRIRIYFDHLAEFRFALPPLHEQRRIAEILSSVDEAIAATRAVIEQTRKVKQGVLESLLTRGIGHTRFKQTEIGEIPEVWDLKRLEEIAEIDRGKFSVRPRNDPRYFSGDVPFVQTGDVVSADGRLRRHSQTLNALGKGVSKEFPAGTILITIAANIGDTAITTYPVCCPDSVVGIVPSNSVNTDWLREFLVLQKPSLDRQATQNAQKNINLQHLRPMQIAVPPVDEQRDIGRRIQAMNDSISENGLELANMESLKSALMLDLLTGRKRVADALPLAAE